MIELQGVSKTYRRPAGEEVTALVDVSLHIGRGEFVAIIGESGSGKSTLMNIIGLLDVPTQGRYRLDGVDVTAFHANDQATTRNRKIGFVFQAFHLLPRTTALENVELPLLYSNRRSITGLARKALETVNLADRIHHRPSGLSGGQQQRVAIARALVNEPDLLLADEPTGNLDRRSAMEIISTFQALNHDGRTIVLVTHDQEIARYTSRIVKLERGQIVADANVKESKIALAQEAL
ncbi:MAG TPA: ABC transporter ATP-binding protein [Candidatus Sulfotelmatobacter sp.]|jgi:ABC-type lipoprotein export system ATPase subunit|nr:ABC transporter ATP-binding protein [Candidatus Sulfotelmatobacter sp.]